VNNAHRTLHGALLDAELLAEVYLAMTRGQESLVMELAEPPPTVAEAGGGVAAERAGLIVLAASAEELAEHAGVLEDIQAQSKVNCVWLELESAGAEISPAADA
jgi:DNA polymerase-3 subunit epsilon